jgi:hypothetical protein
MICDLEAQQQLSVIDFSEWKSVWDNVINTRGIDDERGVVRIERQRSTLTF